MAKNNKTTEIVLTGNSTIKFADPESCSGNVLFIGNFTGICGGAIWHGYKSELNRFFVIDNFSRYNNNGIIQNNLDILVNTIKNGHKIVFVGSNDSIKYWKALIYNMIKLGFFSVGAPSKYIAKQIGKHFHTIDTTPIYENAARLYNPEVKTTLTASEISKRIKDFALNKIFGEIEKHNMKFKNIIQNPPYNGSLHLDFLEKGLDLLEEDGHMVIIEPATWLINVRKNGKAKKYDAIKKRIEGHVESVVIENLNEEFGIAQDFPFATTTIDMSKTFDTIKFECCGEKKKVESIYDCNLIGNYKTIQSIIEKTEKYHTHLQDRIHKGEETSEAYIRFWNYQLYALGSNYGKVKNQYTNKTVAVYRENNFGDYFSSYVDSLFYEDIKNNVPLSKKKGKPCDCLFGTSEELKNWVYNVKHCKLLTFLTIATVQDKNNEAGYVTPFLCDRKYTDSEVNDLFSLTDDEVMLINRTVKKFEYNSPWFKRYMCGPDSVSDEEVNNFIQEISK